MHKISLSGIGREQGLGVSNSGERMVVDKVLEETGNEITIFDVGANKGQYTTIVISELRLRTNKKAKLHLFEPSFHNISILNQKFLNKSGDRLDLYINQIALSDSEGRAELFTDALGSDLASIFNLRISYKPFREEVAEKVQTVTLDGYCKSNKISEIDLLKLDVEGAELLVLKGATELLSGRKIRFIQFEFGTGNITSRTFFYDFWDLLSESYDFYQVLKDGLFRITKYETSQEIFVTTNFLLKRKV